MVITQLLTRMIQGVSQDPPFLQLSFVFFQGFHRISTLSILCCRWIRSFYPQVSRVVHLHEWWWKPHETWECIMEKSSVWLRISWSQGPTESSEGFCVTALNIWYLSNVQKRYAIHRDPNGGRLYSPYLTGKYNPLCSAKNQGFSE